jgi:hypothetical protein
MSRDMGATWSLMRLGNRRKLPEAESSYLQAAKLSAATDSSLTSVSMSPSGGVVIGVLSGGSLLVSTNSGVSFSQLSTGIVAQTVFCGDYVVIAIDTSGCAYSNPSVGYGAWTKLAVACVGYSSVTISGNYIVLAYASSGYVAYSADRGVTFSVVSTGGRYNFNNVVASNSGQYLAATSSGADCIRLSSTYGLTWSCSPSSQVALWTSLSMDASGSGIVAGGANTQLYAMQTREVTPGSDDGSGSQVRRWFLCLLFSL